jgi:CHAT domain-containing protein
MSAVYVVNTVSFKRRLVLLLFLITPLFNPLLALDLSPEKQIPSENELKATVKEILHLLMQRPVDKEQVIQISEKLEINLDKIETTDMDLLSSIYYAIGFCHYLTLEYSDAIKFTEKAIKIRENAGLNVIKTANYYSNLGGYWYMLGENHMALKCTEKAVSLLRSDCPKDSSALATYYLNITSMYLELNERKKAIEYVEAGLALSRSYPNSVDPGIVGDLYQDFSILLLRDGEPEKSLIYANEALRLYSGVMASKIDSWARMVDNVASLYRRLNQPVMQEKYLRMGIEKSTPENVDATHGLIISYAQFLMRRSQYADAVKVLEKAIANSEKSTEKNTVTYPKLMSTYAAALFGRDKNIDEVTGCFSKCFQYIDSHTWDVRTREIVLLEYAGILFKAQHYEEAVSNLNKILERYNIERYTPEEIQHTDLKLSIYANEAFLLKYRALNALAKQTGNKTYTLLAINCGEKLTSIFDRRRLELSEDKSRTILSDSTRKIYTGLVDDYCMLYKSDQNPLYLEKAFEFSERSKVAGFLAVTRQLNATRFSIPKELLGITSELKEKIGSYREMIEREKLLEKPNYDKIEGLERYNFKYTRSLDSLIGVFEKNYPAFYNLKYNTRTASLESVDRIIGPKENLLSYILTDERLYIFVINQSHNEVIIRDLDKTFSANLERFREIISTMPSSTDARASFDEYMFLAHDLYLNLIAPAEPLLISNRLTISPDNLLSYIPFESLITSEYKSKDLLYRNAPFLIKSKKISYIFSATLSSETIDIGLHLKNSTIAFAPTYGDRELSDSVIKYFPKLKGKVPDLPFAAEEAQTAVNLCGGKVLIGPDATESAYKNEASGYDIIHLAMHTLLDDENPLYSKMIFSEAPGSTDDGLLNTYEVYNVPLKARMVVLSSCNTGSGRLTSGEGIQSLARGFISSGGKSVVMSMWEVEDFAGAEVVKLFYKSIKRGITKSQALRRAKLDFLEQADQRRSHPYFWSTLIVYGDDSPLYYSTVKLGIAAIALLIALFLLVFIVFHDIRS